MEDYHRSQHFLHQLSSKESAKIRKSPPIKVKYISSPMKVTAKNPTEFRAIVQELTGQNADHASARTTEIDGTRHDEDANPGQVLLLHHGNTTLSSMATPALTGVENQIVSTTFCNVNEASFFRDPSDSLYEVQFPCVPLLV
ncbi:hypothetical protein NMG60_11022179 [Bertholletia excelsa]